MVGHLVVAQAEQAAGKRLGVQHQAAVVDLDRADIRDVGSFGGVSVHFRRGLEPIALDSPADYKYTDFAPSAAEFQKEAEKRVRELHCYDVLRADRCISVNSLEARVPFGDLDFVEYVMSVDPALKVNRCGKGKYLLRRAFQSDALLPDEILWREKAAFSDAVGHSMVDDLKEYARAQYSDLAFTRGCAQYQYRPPFTRESLLYRDLFERYYPGQARMIKDFWMPNRAWEGCNVDDPSARALKNYGASGF